MQDSEIACFGFRDYEEVRGKISNRIHNNIHLDSCRVPPEIKHELPIEWKSIDLELITTETREEEVMKMLRHDVSTTENNELDS